MPRYDRFNDTESTYEVKNYEIKLSCSKCPAGELVATDQPAPEGSTVHECSGRGRVQLVEGLAYPRSVTRREFVSDRRIDRVIELPDKTPDEYDVNDVSKLSESNLIELLRTTHRVQLVDFIERVASYRPMLELVTTLFDLARQAATLRGEVATEPEPEMPYAHPSFGIAPDDLAKLLLNAHTPERIEEIQHRCLSAFTRTPAISKALFENARQVVEHRVQAAAVA